MIIRQSFLIFLSIIYMSNSCEKGPLGAKKVDSFWIKNNTNEPLIVLISTMYPDTTIPNNENNLFGAPAKERVPFDIHQMLDDFFTQLPADTLSVFFFDSDTLVKYGFDQVRLDYNILKRKEISLADLENNEFTIPYP